MIIYFYIILTYNSFVLKSSTVVPGLRTIASFVISGIVFSIILINVLSMGTNNKAYGQLPQFPVQTPESPTTPSNRTTQTENVSSPPLSTSGAAATTTTITNASQFVLHGVRITSPVKGQQIPAGNNTLTISGVSKDNATTNCQVSIIVNNVRPYQHASATGPGGPGDYSKWNFTLTPKYTSIKEGQDKITARFSCKPDTSIASFYNINVVGTRKG